MSLWVSGNSSCKPVFKEEKVILETSLILFAAAKLTLLIQSVKAAKLFTLSGGFSTMTTGPSDSSQALLYCVLLAFQFGLQPMIANRFTSGDISKTSVVIGTEFGKIIIAFMSIMSEPAAAREKIFGNWSLVASIKKAALPATLYAIQNLFVQHGYVLLDSMTFNLLNQTKVTSSITEITILCNLDN